MYRKLLSKTSFYCKRFCSSNTKNSVPIPKGGRIGQLTNESRIEDDKLQGHWKSMESRTINRPPPRPKGSVAGRVGLRRSEEEYWSEAGVYDFDNKADIKYSKNDTEKKTD